MSNKGWWIVFWIGAVLCLSTPPINSSSSQIYKWADDSGTLGFTDDLANVPAKYRKNAILESEPPAPRQEKESSEIHQGFPSLNDTDDAGHDRAYWQGRMNGLRDRRAYMANRRTEIEEELEALVRRLRKGDRTSLELRTQLVGELAKAKAEIEDIDHQLEDVIPEEARKTNAPPGWLR